MIEKTTQPTPREQQALRRRGIFPSKQLRRHFIALARQVCQWSKSTTLVPEKEMGFSIGVTSLKNGAGKSTISFNLAAALTTVVRNQILLLEADFGNPDLSRRLELAKEPGLGEILSSDVSFEESIHSTPVNDLITMGCGLKSDQESVELPFDILPHLMEDHFTDFGYVVLDLPAANHLTACYSITPHLDGVILAISTLR